MNRKFGEDGGWINDVEMLSFVRDFNITMIGQLIIGWKRRISKFIFLLCYIFDLKMF